MVAGEIWSGRDAEKALQFGADLVALGKAAIGIPDWPTKAKSDDFMPQKPPYTEAQLLAADLSATFVGYMKKWPNFVAE